MVFTSALPRVVQRLSYNFFTQLYVNHSNLDAISNRLDWSGLFLTSKTSELQLSAYVVQSQTNGVTDYGAAQITTAGRQSFWGSGVNQSFSWEASPSLRLNQGALFTAYIPTTDGIDPNYTANANLGLSRSWRRDLFAGTLSLGYFRYGETRGPTTNSDGTVNPNGVLTATQQQITGNFLFEWRHDFANFWTLNLGAGVATLFRAEDGGGQVWQPAADAGVHYTHPKVQLELSYNRGMVPNPVVQQTFVADTVGLRGTVPFGEKSHVALSGGANYVHYQAANTISGGTGATVDLFYVDGALTWTPRDWLVVFTRYTYQNQLADATQQPPLASIERHQLLVGLTATYPAQGAAYLPKGPPVRVDRSDAVTIPDVHTKTQ